MEGSRRWTSWDRTLTPDHGSLVWLAEEFHARVGIDRRFQDRRRRRGRRRRMTTYTAAQAEAIACLDEPLQIIACAGSGKTQVISQRIASILSLPGVEPRNVIAFTFTEKAAAELKERILLDRSSRSGVEHLGLAEMYVGTMHGYALDLVQRLVPETFKFSVLTDITPRLLVDRNSKKSGLTVCPTSRRHADPASLPALEALPAGDQRPARGRRRRDLVPRVCIDRSRTT